jgi:5-methylthioadenosine/S-adenosylhomocysteine deaminase
MKRTAVRGAHIVKTSNDIIRDSYVIIENGLVADITKDLPEGDFEVIGGRHDIVMPGLVNAHNHAAMTLFRGIADDMKLEVWWNKYMFPLEQRFVDKEFEYLGTLLACLEMIKSGTTAFCDGYFFMDEGGRAIKEAGMRAWLGDVLSIYPTPSVKDPAATFERTEEFILRWIDDEMVKPTVFPHAVYTNSLESLKKAHEIACKYDVVLQTHISETIHEVEDCRKKYGMSPVKVYDKAGCLSERVVAAHCVAVDDDDIRILAERKVTVAHCAKSNKKLASGIAPVDKMLKAGVRISIGTDGCASNNNLDMFSEMSTAAKLHKVDNLDPTVMSAHDVLEMATANGARMFRIKDGGRIEKGCPADIIVLDGNAPNLVPVYNPISHAIYAAHGTNVKDTIIAGKVVMKNFKCLTIDEKTIIKECRKLQKKIEKQL